MVMRIRRAGRERSPGQPHEAVIERAALAAVQSVPVLNGAGELVAGTVFRLQQPVEGLTDELGQVFALGSPREILTAAH